MNRKTGMPFIAPSSAYKHYEEQAINFLTQKPKTPLAGRCRVVTVFYMKTRRKCDVSNCLEAAHDLLVKGRILADDNYTIIESVDGSRVKYDKDNPRTEITIEELEE